MARATRRLNFTELRRAAAEPPPGIALSSSHKGPWVQIFSPVGLVWTTARLKVRHLPPELDGLRLLHLSDIHMRGYWGRGYDELIARVAANPPDMILITGDFAHSKVDPRPALPHLRKLLAAMPSRLGTYGILGNHDSDYTRRDLVQMGVTLVGSGRAVVAVGEASIELIGLPGVWRSDYDQPFVKTMPPRVDGLPRVVLCHFPDLYPAARQLDPDLYLAGHTHGGQICLPGGYPVLTHDRMPRRFCRGIHRVGDCWFIVSRGLGFSGPPIRICCPAEAVELTLVT